MSGIREMVKEACLQRWCSQVSPRKIHVHVCFLHVCSALTPISSGKKKPTKTPSYPLQAARRGDSKGKQYFEARPEPCDAASKDAPYFRTRRTAAAFMSSKTPTVPRLLPPRRSSATVADAVALAGASSRWRSTLDFLKDELVKELSSSQKEEKNQFFV